MCVYAQPDLSAELSFPKFEEEIRREIRQSGLFCCSVLQCVAVCCSVLQCVAVLSYVRGGHLSRDTPVWSLVPWCAAVRFSAWHCVVVCCSVLQCVAMLSYI